MNEKTKSLYERASRVIPGGSQMYNKRPVIYGQADYPLFSEKVGGPYLYDIEGKRYIDYLLAYGAIHLGYNYDVVNNAVIERVSKGTISSINDPLEIELAEELASTIPSAEMSRFFLSGSEATSAAVRIARAYTKREKIVKGGYHGWHDWTSVNNQGPSKGMKRYLEMINCPVSSITHVPRNVSKNTYELEYNNTASLKAIMEKDGENIACVIMEAFYFDTPKDNFLEEVKRIAHEYGTLLIFDEVKTGVRVSNGGAQEYLNVFPDMSVFSKAISNGFPFSVVVGSKAVMGACEDLWFAGTNCGNAVGISAALATIRESRKRNAVQHIWRLGERIMKGIDELIMKYEVPAVLGGLPPMPFLLFNAGTMHKKKEMTETYLSALIQRGVFMPVEHCFYISYTHSIEDIDTTLNAIEEAFKLIQ